MNEKFKNYGLWLSLFALLGLMLRDMNVLPLHYGEYVETIMYILLGLGIVSNPTNGKGYIDNGGAKG